MYLRVKAKEGRVAYTAARGGERIPTDRYITVEATHWVQRLLNVHRDIVLEPVAAPKTEVAPEAAKTKVHDTKSTPAV